LAGVGEGRERVACKADEAEWLVFHWRKFGRFIQRQDGPSGLLLSGQFGAGGPVFEKECRV